MAHPLRATRQILQLAPAARAYATAWDEMDSAARTARQRGDVSISAPAPHNIADLEDIQPYPGNYVTQCASDYYGVAISVEPQSP